MIYLLHNYCFNVRFCGYALCSYKDDSKNKLVLQFRVLALRKFTQPLRIFLEKNSFIDISFPIYLNLF